MTCLTQTLDMSEMIANESCGFMEVTLQDVAAAGDKIYVNINSSFLSPIIEVINDGETKTYYDESCKETWTVKCIGIFGTSVIIELCFITEEEPPVIPCANYTTEAECIAAGCYWYDGSCHGTAEAPGGDVEPITIPGQPWVAPVQSLALHVEEIGGLPNIVNCRDDETIRIMVIADEKLVGEAIDISWTRTGAAVGDIVGIGLPFAYTVIDGVPRAKVEFDWIPGASNIGTGLFHATMTPTDQWTQGGSSNELGFEVLASVCTVRVRVDDQAGNRVGGLDVNVGGTHIFTLPDADTEISLRCGQEYSALALGNEDYRCEPSSQCSKVFIASEGLVVVLNITKTAALGKIIVPITWEACHPYGGCSSAVAYWGSEVSLTVRSQNIGNADGEFRTKIIDNVTEAIIAETTFVPIVEGASATHTPTFTMPEVNNLNIRAELIRNA